MKKLRGITVISLYLLIILFYSCNSTSPEVPNAIPYEETQMEGMDKVSIGGELEVVIKSQKEYDELIYQRFQKPLDDYWNANYESVLQSVKQQNPGLTDEEYEDLVRQVFYSVLPFRGTENYTHPVINFSKYTLLGQEANSGGCELPDYNIEIERNGKEYIFWVTIKRKGDCEMGIPKNKWVLIPKIASGYRVKFNKVEIR